jgi:FtsH-binding integral membrane protein
MELALLITVVGGLVAAGIATTKDRNPFGWFLIGGLFPLIGIILAIVLPAVPVPQVEWKR